MFDNVGETTIKPIEETLTSTVATVLSSKLLKKGGFSITMEGVKSVETMCNLS